MDSLRAFDEQSDYGAAEDDGGIEVPPEIGLDERRMHVRAYNYWVSLLDGRAYPSITALDPQRSAISVRTASCSISPKAATIRRSRGWARRCARNAT